MKASAKSHLTKRLGDLPWKVRGKAKRVPNNSIFERRVTLLMSKRSAICVLLRTAQCLFQNVELCCEVENSSIIKDVLTYPMPFSSALYCVYPLLMGSSSGSRYLLKHNTPHQAKKHRRQSGKQETRTRVPRGHHVKGDFPGERFAECEFGGDHIYNPASISKS
ncbi:hypothetical protein MG293_010480 [Ovis ammon polii]|uniref:Uncharacterized protein n=1 Tax=Ovis ammon polii TaxID=230172 RepID=A0AAD4U2D8_OVIAM|nr:hypothetical protein MG293_010480 [Ovis ammon polii]